MTRKFFKPSLKSIGSIHPARTYIYLHLDTIKINHENVGKYIPFVPWIRNGKYKESAFSQLGGLRRYRRGMRCCSGRCGLGHTHKIPSLKQTVRPWKSLIFPGKYHQNGGCSHGYVSLQECIQDKQKKCPSSIVGCFIVSFLCGSTVECLKILKEMFAYYSWNELVAPFDT